MTLPRPIRIALGRLALLGRAALLGHRKQARQSQGNRIFIAPF